MNKDLYGKKIELPEDVVGYLKQCHDSAIGADENTEGYRRNKELRDTGFVTYQQLNLSCPLVLDMQNSTQNHQRDL